MRKFELLILSETIQLQKNTTDIVEFLNELLKNMETKEFFITYEMNLFIYNIILNTYHDYVYLMNNNWKKKVRKQMMEIIRRVFNNSNILTKEHIDKINSDIDYIEKHKKYTYIYDIVWYTYYFFF